MPDLNRIKDMLSENSMVFVMSDEEEIIFRKLRASGDDVRIIKELERWNRKEIYQ